MKAKDIQTGQVYIIRHHDGKLHKVRVDSITENYSGRTRYNCTKLSTNREILVRSAAKFRYPAKPEYQGEGFDSARDRIGETVDTDSQTKSPESDTKSPVNTI